MVNSAERHGELVAHFAAKRTRLRRTKMMGIRGLPPANQARLCRHELTVFFVTDAPRFADRKHAFVDAATETAIRGIELGGVRSRIKGVRPRARCGDTDRHCGGSRWAGVRKTRLHPRPVLAGLPPGQRRSPSECFWRAGSDGPSRPPRRRTEGRRVRRPADPAAPPTDPGPEPASPGGRGAFGPGLPLPRGRRQARSAQPALVAARRRLWGRRQCPGHQDRPRRQSPPA
jgi:hypothetical protein